VPDFRHQPLGAPLPLSHVAGGFTGFQLGVSTTKIAWSFNWKGPTPASPITHLGFRYHLRTGTPPTYKISLQGRDASGNPDGTLKGGGNPTFTPPADTTWDGTFRWISLGANTYTPARGEKLCIVVEYSSGTIDGSNRSAYTQHFSSGRQGHPCNLTNSGSWVKNIVGYPIFGLKNATRTWGFPLQSFTATSINTTTQHAMAFKIDAATMLGLRIAGVRFVGQLSNAAGKSVLAKLYQDTTAVGHDATLDADDSLVNNSELGFEVLFDEATMSMLKPGVQYHLAFEPQEADTNFQLAVLGYSDAQDAGAYPGGAQFQFASRASGGATAWTLDATKRPLAELIVEETVAHNYQPERRIS
jgi:hypothetical protein